MTTPAPETIERDIQEMIRKAILAFEEQKHGKLYLSDAELIRLLGVPEKHMRKILPGLESKYGFPRKQPLFGDRRYWPAVKAWLDKRNGLDL